MQGTDTAKATLVRFWTDHCPHCRLSLPAIEALRREFHDRGLETIAIYHTRAPHLPSPKEVETAARAMGYEGPVAMDLQWKALSAVGLGERQGRTTSATFLFDQEGSLRFRHPGPEIHESGDPLHRSCQQDFEALHRSIEAVLR
jgi:thiol-disulfide isomerase/thioredoxin